MHRSSTAAGIAALFLAAGAFGDTRTPAAAQPWEKTDALPAAVQGRFPVHMPRYEGVDQFILLSSRWIVLVTANLDEVYRKVDELSGGAFFKAIEKWDASEKAKRPDWTAYRGRGSIRDTYVAQARELCGERKLDEPAFYAVSGDDPNYAAPQAPLRVTRTIVGLGGETAPRAHAALRGVGGVYYAHYSYLELPHPLAHGRVYTVRLGDGRSCTFAYDETRTVSRAIKVNQVGYVPGMPGRYAYLGAWLGEFGPHDFDFARTFSVVSVDTGEVVYTNAVTLRDDASRCAVPPGKQGDPAQRPLLSGEKVYALDLGGLKAEGTFFITIPGVGRSWPFRHAADTYGEAFYTACRGLFHQRCGIALEAPHTPWTRIRCHTNAVYECAHIPWGPGADFQKPKGYEIFDVIGGSIGSRPHADDVEGAPPAPKTENVVGGWHDAADWDRGIYHYSCVFSLLNAYELAPRKFTDGQLNIPESGNGTPDILDEAEFGLRVWKLSMTPEGGVAGMVETWTHPTIDDPAVQYAFSRRTRWSSLVFAAAAAQYAHLVAPFEKAGAADYAEAAKKAYAFGSDPAHSLGKTKIRAAKNRGQGAPYTLQWEEKDEMIKPFLAHARTRLALLTGDAAYLEGIPELTRGVLPPYLWPNTYGDFSPWLYTGIPLQLASKLPPETVAQWKTLFVGTGDELAALNPGFPYRCSWPAYQDYWMAWGANVMVNRGRALLIAHALSGDPKHLAAAAQNADFMFGANPMGMSWTTGMGYVYPIDIQHANSEKDGVLDPVPGITLYGVTGGAYPLLRDTAWRSPKAAGSKEFVDFVKPANRDRPVWRQWSCHPHENTAQCEFTVHETMAATIFTCAMLMPDGWKPGEELKRRRPRPDEALFGYYYLP